MGLHTVTDKSSWTRFYSGFAAPFEGFVYLCRNPQLWVYGLLPVLLNLVITAVVFLILLAAVVGFVVYLHPRFPDGWMYVGLEILTAIGCLLLALGLSLVAWIFLKGVLCGYFQAVLAREVEIRLGLPREQMQEISWKYQLFDAFRDVAALVGINGGLLLLQLVPVLGSISGLILTLYFDWKLFGTEYFDYPLSLRGKRRSEKQEFIRSNRNQTLGLGACVFLANLIPIVGAVLLSTAAVGAVLLHHRLGAVSGDQDEHFRLPERKKSDAI